MEWGGKKDPPDEVPYSECLAQVTLHIKLEKNGWSESSQRELVGLRVYARGDGIRR